MDSSASVTTPSLSTAAKWQPLSAIDRRVVGVLVEKSKTTPAYYPLTLNAIVTAANQKSNRHPEMQLTADDVQESLDRLRELGAVGEVFGDGRVPKYRHYLYEWLGVEKAELAVMAELLLRGAQSIGDLRAHTARMEPLADLGALRPIVQSLMQKGLLLALSPEGRGQIISHALYPPRELEKLKAELGLSSNVGRGGAVDEPASTAARSVPATVASTTAGPSPETTAAIAELRREVEELRAAHERLRKDFDELRGLLT